MLYILAAFFIIPLTWIALKFAPWAAPLSGVLGLIVGTVSVFVESSHGMQWGFGLFGFSSLLFVLGGGMAGR
jgi:hypothetical protein